MHADGGRRPWLNSGGKTRKQRRDRTAERPSSRQWCGGLKSAAFRGLRMPAAHVVTG